MWQSQMMPLVLRTLFRLMTLKVNDVSCQTDPTKEDELLTEANR